MKVRVFENTFGMLLKFRQLHSGEILNCRRNLLNNMKRVHFLSLVDYLLRNYFILLCISPTVSDRTQLVLLLSKLVLVLKESRMFVYILH